MKKGIFVAATDKDVGKTTTCLGLLAGLKKRFSSVGFLKPVGQRTVLSQNGHEVDKDVALFKHQFDLPFSEEMMSPVTFKKNFTKLYLDGLIDHKTLVQQILNSYEHITQSTDFTIVEGTGHSAVGSIAQLNNAQVAKLLNLDVLLVVPAGLGNAFDLLMLNKVFFENEGVKIAGVILNKVHKEKLPMIQEYFPKALEKLGVPLVGCVPYHDFLSAISMKDLSKLLRAEFISGSQYAMRHFTNKKLVAISQSNNSEATSPNQLVITSAKREDVITTVIDLHKQYKEKHEGKDMEGGLLLTGKTPPCASICRLLEEANIPAIYTPLSHYITAKEVSSFSAKIDQEDETKVIKAISLMEKHIRYSALGLPSRKKHSEV